MINTPVILLVEDDPDHIQLMEIVIQKEMKESQIIHASNATECLQLMNKIQPDLVVLDYSLPDQNGIQVLASIRQKSAKLPVLMVTGQGNEKIAVDAMKEGATDYIMKSSNYLTYLPVTISRILEENKERIRLHETELYYRDLVENASDGIYLLDDAGHIRMVNRISEEMSGYERTQLIGHHFSVLFDEKDYKRILNEVKKLPQLKQLPKYRTHIVHKSGKRFPVELSVIPVKQNDDIIGYQGIVHDISDRLKFEEERLRRTQEVQKMNDELIEKNRKLQELHEVKTQFVSNVGHELRTPLNGILGYAELLKDGLYGTVNDPQIKALDQILNSGNHLLNLINELLDFSKIQSGRFKIYKEAVSIYELVNAAVETIEPTIKNKDLRLFHSLENDLPQIWADSRRIFQVLLNLLSNAIKFTTKGKINIHVIRKEDFVQFEIQDTGIGIELGDKEKIFQDFHQVDGGLSRNYGGTGLGLSLSKYIIELHQGEIWVESFPGKGSTFYFRLPINGQFNEKNNDKLNNNQDESKQALHHHKKVIHNG